MTEELVTLETAKLLKEKGFNEYCKDIIKEDDNRIMQSAFRTNKNLPKLCYSRPTQSVAQKWLRETKKQIGEDFTRDERVLNKLKRNEQ